MAKENEDKQYYLEKKLHPPGGDHDHDAQEEASHAMVNRHKLI